MLGRIIETENTKSTLRCVDCECVYFECSLLRSQSPCGLALAQFKLIAVLTKFDIRHVINHGELASGDAAADELVNVNTKPRPSFFLVLDRQSVFADGF